MTSLGMKSQPRYLNHLIKKKKKELDDPPSPVFESTREERIYNLAN